MALHRRRLGADPSAFRGAACLREAGGGGPAGGPQGGRAVQTAVTTWIARCERFLLSFFSPSTLPRNNPIARVAEKSAIATWLSREFWPHFPSFDL